MPSLKFQDTDGVYKPLAYAMRGDKGDKGDKGDPGAPGGMGPLDALQDVTAPSDTAAGKLLGTTASGQWEPVDPPVTGLTQTQADARYLQLIGGSLTGALSATSLTISGSAIFSAGASMGGSKLTSVANPTTSTDGANKAYVDARIWTGTQAQYDAIPTKDPAVLYVVVG